ncbi:hypothetical protein ACFVWX_13450 [Streptomyces sp. NPDC058220]|uniref:hypothetical protein n=1 Tax=Streptomyces sp. NPDC058220 TaxID=3346387 RepID=UPI0036EAE5E6
MTNDMMTKAGEPPTEHSPGLARRTADGLRTGLTGEAATALAAGSLVLLRKGWAYVTPRLTVGERWLYGGGAGYALIYTAGNVDLGPAGPFVAPGAVVTWCVAAWIVSPPPGQHADDHEPAQPAEEPAAVDREFAFVADLIRSTAVAHGHQGAHLADVVARSGMGRWEQPDLKHALVHDWGVPVAEIKLRFHGRQRVRDGVRLRDLPPPTEKPPAEPPPGTPAAAAVEAAATPSPHLLADPTPEPR